MENNDEKILRFLELGLDGATELEKKVCTLQ